MATPRKTAAEKAAEQPTPPEQQQGVADKPAPEEVQKAAQPPNIVEALSRVREEVGAVRKAQQAPGNIGGYQFRGIDAVVNATAGALNRHRVVVMPEVLSVERATTPTKQGGTMLNTYVLIRYTFHGPAGDYLSATVLGEGSDPGDKSGAKAQSVAMRVALLQALNLPTDDPDPDMENYERAGAQQQREQAPPPENVQAVLRRWHAMKDTRVKQQVQFLWGQSQVDLPNGPLNVTADTADEALAIFDAAEARVAEVRATEEAHAARQQQATQDTGEHTPTAAEVEQAVQADRRMVQEAVDPQ